MFLNTVAEDMQRWLWQQFWCLVEHEVGVLVIKIVRVYENQIRNGDALALEPALSHVGCGRASVAASCRLSSTTLRTQTCFLFILEKFVVHSRVWVEIIMTQSR
jgi:hypothetical protein